MTRHDAACRFPALQVVLPKYTQAQCLSIIATFLKENGFTSTATVLSLEGRHLNCAVNSTAHLTKEELDQHVALCISRLGHGPAADVEPADRSPAAHGTHAKQEAGPHEPGGESVLDLINEDLEIDDGLGPCSGDAANISRRATEDVDQEGQIPGWPRSSRSKSPDHGNPRSSTYRHRSDSRDGDEWRAAKPSPGREQRATRVPSSALDALPDSRHASPDREEREEGEDGDGDGDKIGQGSPHKEEEDGRDRSKQETSEQEDGQRKWRRSRSSSPAASGRRSPSPHRAHSHDSDRRRASPDPTANADPEPPGSTEAAEGVVPSRNKVSAPKYLILSGLVDEGKAGNRNWAPRPEPERHSRREDDGRDYPAARGAGEYPTAPGGSEPRFYHERDKLRYDTNSRASPVTGQVDRTNREPARPMPASSYGRDRDRDREPAGAYRSGERARDSPRDYPRASTTSSPGYERHEKSRVPERALEKSRDGYDAYRREGREPRDRRPEPRGASEGGREARGSYRSADDARAPRPRLERSDVRPSSREEARAREDARLREEARAREEARGSGRARSAERSEVRPSSEARGASALLPPPPAVARYSQARDSAGQKRHRDEDYR